MSLFWSIHMSVIILGILTGCTTSKPQDSTPQDSAITDTAIEDTAIEDTSTTDTAPEEPTCHEISAFVTWNDATIDLSFLIYDEGAAYFFGMAQSGNINNRWTGEDCLYGFSTPEQDYMYCHPAQLGISLSYGASYNDIIEGFSTHFAGPEFSEEITYIIKDTISDCCWVWGKDPSYYDELSCSQINQ